MSTFTDLNITTLKKIAKVLKIRGFSKYKKDNKGELVEEIQRLKIDNPSLDEDINKIIASTSKVTRSKGDNFPNTSEWVRVKQLGKKGKDGRIFLVINEDGNSYAMKTFRQNKNSESLMREIKFQETVAESEYDITPKIIEYNLEEKYIVMEKMDRTLVEIIESQDGKLDTEQQKEIIKLFSTLDTIGVFHNDANPLNIMMKENKFYIIDFGFSNWCNHSSLKGVSHPNTQFMTVGLLIYLSQKGYDPSDYEYLLRFVPKKVKAKILER